MFLDMGVGRGVQKRGPVGQGLVELEVSSKQKGQDEGLRMGRMPNTENRQQDNILLVL